MSLAYPSLHLTRKQIISGKVDICMHPLLPAVGRASRSATSQAREANKIKTLSTGYCFGDFALIGDTRWTAAWNINADIICSEDAEIWCVHVKEMEQVLYQSTFCKMRLAIVSARFCLANLKWALHISKNTEPESAAVRTTKDHPPKAVRWMLLVMKAMLSSSKDASRIEGHLLKHALS
uniref:Cyclic nucleotide-binding domain-containing protein n=1 Tax=Cryptomonas curvata TaxID=233186 RepID=A0A7S0QH79_9CRYP|mmetsp:Transcript_23892/g.49975  ORF Transcript_23892/g.49975 Transcript_23892/m.49975 type:complete len:179 (+) Transcript_23892:187-723(+)